MYQIYADDDLIFDSTLDDLVIGSGEVSLVVNESGTFTFSLFQDHPYYDRIVKLKTIITVYKNGVLKFRGRALTDKAGLYNEKVYTCEGELAFLRDSIQRPYTFEGSPTALFTQYITNHNAQVDADKQFTVGQITVEDPNDYIARSDTEYTDTLSLISEALVGPLGGYLYISSGDNGERVINWFADFPYISTQSIEFGENLLDFSRLDSGETIATAIIPLGAKQDTTGDTEEETRLTIESVTDGSVAGVIKSGDYIYNQAAVNQYGWIFKVVTWDDVEVANNLVTKAAAYLNELINLNVTLELTAVDLANMDSSIESFSLGDYVPVVSVPHGINARYLLKQQTFDLLHAENDKITLGYRYSTFTETTVSNANKGTATNKKVEKIESNYVPNAVLTEEVEALRSMINQTSESIVMEVLQEYVTNDEVTTAVSTIYTQLNNAFEFAFNTLEQTINDNDASTREEFEAIRKYIRFEDGNIILGESGNELVLKIENDQIVFYDGFEAVAYLSNRTLYITDAEVLNSIIIGNYAFIPRENGNLSFKKVR